MLSNNRYNQEGSDVLVAGITSQIITRGYTVPLDTPELEVGIMKRPSVVRADKVFSIDRRIVVAQLGRVGTGAFDRILNQLATLIARGA